MPKKVIKVYELDTIIFKNTTNNNNSISSRHSRLYNTSFKTSLSVSPSPPASDTTSLTATLVAVKVVESDINKQNVTKNKNYKTIRN